MKKLIDEFNDFFKHDAKVVIKGNELHITIGGRTMSIRLPFMVGGSSMAPSRKS